ncbi:MAG: zinc-finger domain-containing protein [Pseudomonadota bacterium]
MSAFNEAKIILVESHKVACNGGGGALGHPLTYYVIGQEGEVRCRYCDRIYRLKSRQDQLDAAGDKGE